MQFTLVIVGGPHAGQTFSCPGPGPVTVGRQGCDVALPRDGTCSTRHFRIEAGPAGVWLRDLGSKNKTYVNNGQQVTAAELHHGDVIQAGETFLRFELASAGDDGPRTLEANWPDIPGFTVECRLGEEVTGVVYLARWGKDSCRLAVKRAERKVSALARRLQREAALLERHVHPHIVAFHSAGISGGQFVLATKYESASTLREWIHRQGPRPLREAIGIVRQLLTTLEALHARGVVHRNVRPGAIGLSGQPGCWHLRLGDFGLAKAKGVPNDWDGIGIETQAGVAAGDPCFVPPEQAINLHDVGPAGDQYAAAAVLYFLLTGHAPYNPPPRGKDPFEQVRLTEPVPIRARRPDLPIELGTVMFRALQRRPRDRFPDLAALEAALVELLK
jgi:serine/threonine protein kinase